MRLHKDIKRCREIFPNIKIKQAREYNCTQAVFCLTECETNIILSFDFDFIRMKFFESETIYCYNESDFNYMVSIISDFLECRSGLLLVYDDDGNYVECIDTYDENLNNPTFLNVELRRIHDYKNKSMESGYITIKYTHSYRDKILFYNENGIIFN